MQLYKLNRGVKFKLLDNLEKVPPAAPLLNADTVYTLGECDGMYANCRDENGNDAYVVAWAEVEPTEITPLCNE
jgi:hypothetical protein